MKLATCICGILLIAIGVTAQDASLEQKLFELPDVIFEQVATTKGYESTWKLNIKQPIDHSDHSKGFFYQRAFLSHRGFDRPTVIATEGYSRPSDRPYELSELLDANQIDIEHRYFGTSIPDSMDYEYLNLEQATADIHHINQLFRQIYHGKWISTGISKGGATTIFYRYFYPEDVDVSVPYVAPINIAFEEPRIYEFLDTVGTEECRQAIYALQLRILESRDEVMPLLEYYAKGAKWEFNYLTFGEAFEYSVLEYPFAFWQWQPFCDSIPPNEAPLTDVIDHLIKVSSMELFSDGAIEKYGSHYYQSAEEMGYYGYETEPFKDLLQDLPLKPHPHAAFVPDKMKVDFDGKLLADVGKWLEKNGDRFLYIYGAYDTWSASAVLPSDKVDSEWFFLSGKHHGTARIKHMTESERSLFVSKLEEWLDLEIE